MADATIVGKTIVTYNLHLESRGNDALRDAQIEEIVDDARRYDADTPILLAGDFNLDLSAGSAAKTIRRDRFQDTLANGHSPTTPGSFFENGRVIDWIFSRGPMRSSQPQVHSSVSASDHYPSRSRWISFSTGRQITVRAKTHSFVPPLGFQEWWLTVQTARPR